MHLRTNLQHKVVFTRCNRLGANLSHNGACLNVTHRCIPINSTVFNTTAIRGEWVTRLTRGRWIPGSREFEPHQRPPLFP